MLTEATGAMGVPNESSIFLLMQLGMPIISKSSVCQASHLMDFDNLWVPNLVATCDTGVVL